MRTVLQPGKEYDFLTPQEMHKGLNDMQGRLVDALVREELRGIRVVKLSGVLSVNQTLIIGTPNAGYFWSILDVAVMPQESGTNYQHINFYVNPKGEIPTPFTSEIRISVFCFADSPYGKGQLLVDQDSQIYANNADTVNQLSYRVWLVEVPAEMVGKLYI